MIVTSVATEVSVVRLSYFSACMVASLFLIAGLLGSSVIFLLNSSPWTHKVRDILDSQELGDVGSLFDPVDALRGIAVISRSDYGDKRVRLVVKMSHEDIVRLSQELKPVDDGDAVALGRLGEFTSTFQEKYKDFSRISRRAPELVLEEADLLFAGEYVTRNGLRRFKVLVVYNIKSGFTYFDINQL